LPKADRTGAVGRSRTVFPRTALLALALLLVGLFVMRTYYGLSLELRTGDDVQAATTWQPTF